MVCRVTALNAMVRMFKHALKSIANKPEILTRLGTVRRVSHNFGYGMGDDMVNLFAEFGFDGHSG